MNSMSQHVRPMGYIYRTEASLGAGATDGCLKKTH